MDIERHDLLHEFPEHKETIHNLKMKDRHFARLFADYHEVDHEVHKIEQGSANSSDEYLEGKKKSRVLLKDQLFAIILAHEKK